MAFYEVKKLFEVKRTKKFFKNEVSMYFWRNFGEVSEWSKEHDWKSCMSVTGHRGFESLSLHQII